MNIKLFEHELNPVQMNTLMKTVRWRRKYDISSSAYITYVFWLHVKIHSLLLLVSVITGVVLVAAYFLMDIF